MNKKIKENKEAIKTLKLWNEDLKEELAINNEQNKDISSILFLIEQNKLDIKAKKQENIQLKKIIIDK